MEIKTVREAVAAQLAGCGKNVEKLVVSRLADAEVEARVADVVAAISKMSELEAEKKALEKFDVEAFDGDGSVATQAYSRKRSEERARNAKAIEKLGGAVDAAFGGNKWAELRRLVKS